MRYNSRIKNSLRYWLFTKLVKEIHNKTVEKTGYRAVFLNDEISDIVQTYGLFEHEILLPLFDILSKSFVLLDSVAIDVGANIENHSVFFSDFFSQVYSFEPNPITYKVLFVNTFYKNNIEIQNYGLSDSQKEVNLSVVKGNIGASSAFKNYYSKINHRIKLIRLDDLNEMFYSNIGLIKIDVEGMEEQVLIGGKEVIDKHLPIILFEQWRSSFDRGISSTVKILLDKGYNMYILKESHYSKNKWFRRIKRLGLMITNGSLKYRLQKIDTILPQNYPMIIAIHNSKTKSDILY